MKQKIRDFLYKIMSSKIAPLMVLTFTTIGLAAAYSEPITWPFWAMFGASVSMIEFGK